LEATLMTMSCDTFWGSHGCDLESGHEGVHVCGSRDPEGVCSQMRKTDEVGHGEVRFRYYGTDRKWGEWTPWNWFTNHGEVV